MERFGKYQLVRRIGSGGMAEVFLARTTVAQGLNKQLVIKKIHPAFARSRQFMAMFVDEAKIALGLNHPNIVQVFDFGQVGDTFFLAMEYVEGMDVLRMLKEAAKQGKQVPFGLCAYIVQQVAKGLDYAHRKTDEFGEPLGIVHRDVSPQNVLVSWDGAVKIVDFGIARARDVHEEEGVIKGKFAYMSPEQARGEAVDRRSDVFAAGIVLFELVCGQPVFPGKGKKVLEKVKAGAIPRPRYINSDIPVDLEQAILKSLTFYRDDRFQTARDLQNALGRFQFQQATTDDELYDSSTLAQFIAQIIPAERRTPSQLPPSADGSNPAISRNRDIKIDTGVSGVEPSDAVPVPVGTQTSEVRERKFVFVLEGNVCGIPALARKMGSTEARRIVDGFFDVAKDIAYKHDAHIHHVGDGEFTFVVGMPVAGDDDATRTIHLALALVDALDGIGADAVPDLRLAVGIQQGVALLRREGGSKFAYDLAEATTTIAKRLAREAHGAEVLVGGRVYRVARNDWKFEALTTIDIPADLDTQTGAPRAEDTDTGVQQARVYRLRGPKERAERMRERAASEGEILGRDLELKALRDIYRDVILNRRKRQILVIGDAGVGKRSLITAFLDSIPTGEAAVLRAAQRVATAYTPYAVVADLARDLLGLAEGAAPHEIRKRLERLAPLMYAGEEDSREARGVLQAVGMLLGVKPGENEEQIDADERRQRILQAMLRVEQRLQGDKPLIIVGEDAHWSDDESRDLFRHLLKVGTTRPILGLVTSRPDERVEKAAVEVDAHVIRLDELGPEVTRELVTRRFVPGESIDELADEIAARAGGNPLFVREMLEALIERGIVVADDEDGEHPGLLRWVRRDAPIQVPTTVEQLIATRLDRLPLSEKEVLLHAATLGRVFTVNQVTALLGRDAGADLAKLTARGLMTVDGNKYAFRNDMTMTVAYSLVSPEDRTRLHREAANRISTSPAYRTGQDDAMIARHLELAGDADKAADRYLKAASHAIDVGGNADAFRQLTRALKLLAPDDHEKRFAARRQREEILRRLARRPQQLREIHNLRKEAEALGDPAKLALAHSRLAQFYIDVGKAPAASRAVAPALQYAREAGDQLAEAETLRLRASIARLVGNNDEALRLCEEALGLCGDDREGLEQRATILNNRGTALWNTAKLEQAIESYAEALVIYRMLNLPRQEARALNNMGIVFAALGEFEEGLAHYKSSLKLDQTLGDRSGIALKLGNIGQTYSDIGDTARAERYLSKALKLAEQMGDGSTTTDVAISLGQVHILRREFERAGELLERGLQLASENRERYQEIRALIYLGLAQVEAGADAKGALELAVSATELARKMPMPVGQTFGLGVQALALHALDRHDEAYAASREAVEIQDGQTKPEGAEQILHIHATMCEAAGKLDEANKAINRAHEEMQLKLSKLHDEELRTIYASSKTAAAIAADFARLSM